jgi:hypothetical protein
METKKLYGYFTVYEVFMVFGVEIGILIENQLFIYDDNMFLLEVFFRE